MSDNITLPREAVEKIHEAWGSEVYPPATSTEWYDIMDALRAALSAPKQEQEPEFMKDILTVTLRVVRGDRVFQIKRFLRLEHIEQLPFKAVGMEADKAWQELDAAMKEDKR